MDIQTKLCLSEGDSASKLDVGVLMEMKLARAVFFRLGEVET